MDYTSTITNLRNKNSFGATILPIIFAYSWMKQYNEMLNFYSNSDNDQYGIFAYKMYGLPKVTNNNSQWHDMYVFWLTTKYAKQFNLTSLNPNDNGSCYKINDLKTAISEEQTSLAARIVNPTNEFNQDDYNTSLEALSNIKNYVNGLFSNLTCSKVLADDATAQNINYQKQVTDNANESQVNAYKEATSGANGGGNKIGIYAGVGVGLIIVIMVLAKMAKKQS
jgi:hypothetical protein